MEFSRQEHWSGSPFPSTRYLPDPGTEPTSPALAGGFFNTEPPGKSQVMIVESIKLVPGAGFTMYVKSSLSIEMFLSL